MGSFGLDILGGLAEAVPAGLVLIIEADQIIPVPFGDAMLRRQQQLPSVLLAIVYHGPRAHPLPRTAYDDDDGGDLRVPTEAGEASGIKMATLAVVVIQGEATETMDNGFDHYLGVEFGEVFGSLASKTGLIVFQEESIPFDRCDGEFPKWLAILPLRKSALDVL